MVNDSGRPGRLALGVPFVTISGRRGGSALAASAVNALAIGADGS